MLKRYLFVVFVAITFIGKAQYWEVGLFGGTSNYSGDLTEEFIDLKEFQPGGGIIVRYNLNQWFTLKSNIYYGKISGDDANASAYDMNLRNLRFESSMLDIGLNAEINIRGYKSGHPRYTSSPYVFFGFSVFRFDPKAKVPDIDSIREAGQWISLQNLGTEGQGTTRYNDREKYALTQISIPLGIGYKYAINRHWNVGVEIGARITFTDYLDDVSKTYVERDIIRGARGNVAYIMSNRTGEILDEPINYTGADFRGDPTNNDLYFFSGVTVSYSILPNRCFRFEKN